MLLKVIDMSITDKGAIPDLGYCGYPLSAVCIAENFAVLQR
jgi:hypothetical protein